MLSYNFRVIFCWTASIAHDVIEFKWFSLTHWLIDWLIDWGPTQRFTLKTFFVCLRFLAWLSWIHCYFFIVLFCCDFWRLNLKSKTSLSFGDFKFLPTDLYAFCWMTAACWITRFQNLHCCLLVFCLLDPTQCHIVRLIGISSYLSHYRHLSSFSISCCFRK